MKFAYHKNLHSLEALMMRSIYQLIFLASFVLIIYGTSSAQESKHIGFCKLFEETQLTERTVLTDAYLYSAPGGDELFYSPLCNNRDFFALADFAEAKNISSLKYASKKFLNKSRPEIYRVRFVGKFSISLPPKYGNLSFMRAIFKVTKIVSAAAELQPTVIPDFEGDAQIIDTASSLHSVNAELMFQMFGSTDGLDIANFLLPETRVVIDGKSMDLNAAVKILTTGNGNRLEHSVNAISWKEDEWRITGTVRQLDQNSVSKFTFDNRFFLQKDNSWKLQVIKIFRY